MFVLGEDLGEEFHQFYSSGNVYEEEYNIRSDYCDIMYFISILLVFFEGSERGVEILI